MEYRTLGDTGLEVSVIGFGAEWIEGDKPQEGRALTKFMQDAGVNIVDCWMADPAIRKILGEAVCEQRDRWVVQGHFGSTWQDGQYTRTREMEHVVAAWEELLACFGGHVELGLLHYVDEVAEFEQIMSGEFIEYVRAEKDAGRIDHIGISTHNTDVALMAARVPDIKMIMFSLNPAFDMIPPTDDINVFFDDATFDNAGLANIDPARERLFALCEANGIGITVMKPFAGGRLLDAATSPFGAAMTPVQCAQYCLDRPAVCSVMAGVCNEREASEVLAYAQASESERAYAHILANAPSHGYFGSCIYCGHCAPCSAGINIALVNKYADLAAMHESVPDGVAAHYRELGHHAGDCTGCRACEARCPFGVAIADKMQQAAVLFGQ